MVIEPTSKVMSIW